MTFYHMCNDGSILQTVNVNKQLNVSNNSVWTNYHQLMMQRSYINLWHNVHHWNLNLYYCLQKKKISFIKKKKRSLIHILQSLVKMFRIIHHLFRLGLVPPGYEHCAHKCAQKFVLNWSLTDLCSCRLVDQLLLKVHTTRSLPTDHLWLSHSIHNFYWLN